MGLPCEQRPHFRGMSWRAKSSLWRQPFNFLACPSVHAQNSSRDSQATGSSNLREFHGNQNCKNYLRTTLLELYLFCFSALPPLVLSILAEKIFLGSSFLGKNYYATNFSKSCLISGELNSKRQFFRLISIRQNTYM